MAMTAKFWARLLRCCGAFGNFFQCMDNLESDSSQKDITSRGSALLGFEPHCSKFDAWKQKQEQKNGTGGAVPIACIRIAISSKYKAYKRMEPKSGHRYSRSKIAVFVNGCFWHGCPAYYRVPRTNTLYWAEKIRRNLERDAETISHLRRKAGWYWFCGSVKT
jgi:DNA mismatch endonuclease Vsr